MAAPDASSSDDQLRAYAARRLKERSDFRWHLVTYVVINGMLWVIWALTRQESGSAVPWPLWVTLFWGVGLAFHAGYAFRVSTAPPAIDREVSRLRDR
jgi:hypothetical protein